MLKEIILKRMLEFADILKFKFTNIENLAFAMKSEKLKCENKGKNHKEYSNEALAFVGDAILKCVLSDAFYSKNPNSSKGELTDIRKEYENNDVLFEIIIGERWINYAYNEHHFFFENPKTNKVSCSKHNAYLEAIIGAIYYDSGYAKTKKWILDNLIFLIEKYK